MTRLLRFITWPAIAGILAAVIILDRLVPTNAPQPSIMDERITFAAAVSRASPSVVNIHTSKVVQSRRHPLADDPFLGRLVGPQGRQRERIERSLGSGVIMSETGYILTNDHVISGAEQILVALQDGRETLAYLIGVDKDTDLAVLKIDLPNVEPIPLAPSTANAESTSRSCMCYRWPCSPSGLLSRVSMVAAHATTFSSATW